MFEHQSRLVEKNPPLYGLWWETGTGKSRALVELIKKNRASAVLVCPKSIKERWIRDIAAFPAPVIVITKEEFRRDYKKLPAARALIIDEAHHFSNPKSQLHKAALWWLKKHTPQFVWLATATPYRSSPWNGYALAALLGQPQNYREFRTTYFREQFMGHRVIHVPKDDPATHARLASFIRELGEVVTLDECVDMPPAVFEYETIPLTKRERKAIASLTEPNTVVRYSKIHQIENGTLKGNEYVPDTRYPNNNKIERIRDIATEVPKLVIFAKYTLQVRAIADALRKDKYAVFTLTGETKDADRVIREANEAHEAVIIINTDKAEGYELPTFQNVVYASLPWSMVSFLQSQGRVRRINKPQRVLYTILTSDGEIDRAVFQSLEKKLDFNLKLYCERKTISA